MTPHARLHALIAQARAHLTPPLVEPLTGDDADRAALSESRELTFAARGRWHEQIHAAQRALDRLAAGTYGRCVDCDTTIQPRRLDAMPTVEVCIPCQVRRERREEIVMMATSS